MTTTTSPDFIFSGSYLLPGSSQQDVIPNGALAVTADIITDLGSRDDLRHRYPEAPVIHEEHGLIMPGLINTHTHAAMSCFRGLADDLPLMDWLEKHIFPIEAKLTPQIVSQATELSIAEMIRSGTTSFCDMYLFSRQVAEAAHSTGIRSWIGEVLYDFPSPCYGSPEDGIRYVRELHEEHRDHPLIDITVDPHSVYTCSPTLLSRLGELAAELASLYVIHLSETSTEVTTCQQRYGCSPPAHLDNLGLLGPQVLASHCVQLSADDISLLKRHDTKVSHCIESNMKLASGIAPAVKLLAEGITLCLGTDGSASNNDVDLFSEMNSVAKMHKVTCMDPTVMSAEQTLHAATQGGARALGAEDRIGSLERGKQADFIVLDLDQPHMIPLYNIPSHLVYVARGGDVKHSFIAGRQVMKNRELLTLDEERLLYSMNEMAGRIIQLRN